MKRVLALTLVLVLAIASSAMADVSFSGKFTATAEMDSFKVFVEQFTLTPGLTFSIKGTNKDAYEVEEEEVVNWELDAGIKLATDADGKTNFAFGSYKLYLNDDYFQAWAWGNGAKAGAVSTKFGMISAADAAPAAGMRARLAVPVMDVAKITVDLTPPAEVRAFVDVYAVENFDIRVGYLRDWKGAEDVNVVAAGVGTTLAAGDIDVDLAAGFGATIAEDFGYAVGFSADSDLTEQLNVGASVKHANKDWEGDGVEAYKTVIAAEATYSEFAFQVGADASFTIEGDDTLEDRTSNAFGVFANYRMTDTVAYDKLFHSDHWFTNDGLAVGAGANFENVKFADAYLNVASPVVEDMVWVLAKASFDAEKDVVASVLARIVPFNKLTVLPFAQYEYNLDTEVSKATVNLKANYLIGSSSTALKFEAEKVFSETAPSSLLKLSIEVPF